jgi:hypothetical protein
MDDAFGRIRDFLVRGRNPDGGWGYRGGTVSRLEPTSWTLLARRNPSELTVLEQWPTTASLFLERPGGDPNYAFHGLALVVMKAFQLLNPGPGSLIAGIQSVKGIKMGPSTLNQQDNSLQGWSWIAETFSWVEPTAWCLLALKKWRGVADVDESRVDIAERLLVDRCCEPGGWNYGNSNMLGQQLKPFVPTTAIALLALHDRPSLPEVRRSLEYLEAHATEERSGSALALASMALQIYGRDNSAVLKALADQLPTTLTLGSHVAAAMALCALDREWTEHVFRV